VYRAKGQRIIPLRDVVRARQIALAQTDAGQAYALIPLRYGNFAAAQAYLRAIIQAGLPVSRAERPSPRLGTGRGKPPRLWRYDAWHLERGQQPRGMIGHLLAA